MDVPYAPEKDWSEYVSDKEEMDKLQPLETFSPNQEVKNVSKDSKDLGS